MASTSEGLSCFDSGQFTNFTTAEGLPTSDGASGILVAKEPDRARRGNPRKPNNPAESLPLPPHSEFESPQDFKGTGKHLNSRAGTQARSAGNLGSGLIRG
jgi:hypothetical protein